jgi:S-adenosylmethionine hydrolase
VSVITLLTDFGTADGYAGIMHGVILQINPKAVVVDVCHDISPQDVHEAAYVLSTVYPYFPAEAIHIVVVDPGVGGERRALGVRTSRGAFVAPDNGVLSYVFAREFISEMVHLTQSSHWLSPLSDTFHGRDVFAPVAAHLSLGVPLADLGTTIDNPVRLAVPEVTVQQDGSILGQVVHVDHFGNLVTNVGRDRVPAAQAVTVTIAERQVIGPVKAYELAVDGQLLALIGSSGYLEIAVRNGNAATMLGVGCGATVLVAGAGGSA